MKKSNRKKFLQFIVLVLFISALFVPQNANRGMIAGIALIGIGITLLSFFLPLFMQHLKAIENLKKRTPKRVEPAESRPDLEMLFMRQIKFQITGKLKEAYPDATWDFVKEESLSRLLDGEPLRIRTRNTDSYNFAEVIMDHYGSLNLQMMTIEALKKSQPSEDNPDDAPQINPQSWYSLIGKPALMELVGDLQARGYEKLFINEQGDVYILNGTEPEVRGKLDHFPPKNYWSELTDIFSKDELHADETEQALELSWLS